ncbi:preprotein translocase subunit SecD [Porphyromonas gingivalis SJD12]|uniref:protein translocase subunit SecDF n=1 Tax=Porphyromonas gingivalis TaxID=837 RepID=UPI000B50E6D2|nr:protein translocase subunit SecDF [Porphyromonas gingivalis]MCE8179416.1 protein translocase subunit SecDF [Porphyromonas gingivalis]OWR81811.1 preprotein translocase subunit SecD [Porphyromonas gingivalis SJD12]
MQNKGFVIVITSALAIICAFYLSFSFVTNRYEKKAKAMGDVAGMAYLDSMSNEKVWFGYTLKEAQAQQIGLGLDLKGGMNVILKLNASDLLRNLSNKSLDPNFNKALENAAKSTEQSDFIDIFVKEYRKLDPNGRLAVIFGSGDLRDQITAKSTDADVVRLLKEKYNSAVEASFNVLRARIDAFGVVAPNLQRLEGQGRILVELPGVKDPERVRTLLQRSANLQFWRTYKFEEVSGDLIAANDRLSELAMNNTDATPETEPATTDSVAATADSAAVAQKEAKDATRKDALFSLLTPVNRGGAVVGVARRANMAQISEMLQQAHDLKVTREDVLFLWGAKAIEDPETQKETDLYELYAIRTNRTGDPDLGGDVVTSAKSDIQNDFGRSEPIVSMTMNEEGARKWARITKDNVGRAIAIVLDGVVYSAPNVNDEITGGRSQISGHFTVEEAGDLANVLNSGKMDATVSIEQENVIGPTLGAESIKAGFLSFLLALVILMCYMCLAYGFLPGLIANGALIVNSFFTLGVLASFHAVLTLSGIAGLVLTLGMAVDANVLIFERIKEELRAGKTPIRAVTDGYGNAFSAIFDSNVTTIITGIILFLYGTGPIRGFATTLIIGLIASFITAVFLTRIVFEKLAKKGRLDKITFTTNITRNLLVNPSYNILGKRKTGFIIPVIIIVLGLIASFTIGLNRGIEFSGGRNYVVKFDQPVSSEAVRSALSSPLQEKVLVTSIGTEGTEVRISTNYKIQEESEETEAEITDKLYQSLKGFYTQQPTADQFLDNIISSQKVSPSMSSDITRGAIWAVLLSMIFMAIYILIRFRDISFSAGVFVSVAATTFCIIALYALLWKILPFTMEIDQNFIAAILAIIGYSLNDTVVVFDRIRETMKLYPNRDRYQVINDALNSTLGRTLNTSLTTFIVMLVIFIFGGATMRSFTFSILLGIVIGTYSTLFVATPLAYEIQKRKLNKAAKK